jgi:hypothetical protein
VRWLRCDGVMPKRRVREVGGDVNLSKSQRGLAFVVRESFLSFELEVRLLVDLDRSESTVNEVVVVEEGNPSRSQSVSVNTHSRP